MTHGILRCGPRVRDRVSTRIRRRCGSISAFVLAVVVLMSGLLLAHARGVIAKRQQIRQDVRYLQTQKLAEAGVLLAGVLSADRADTESDDGQEWNWNLAPGSIHQTNSGRLTISMTETGDYSVRATWGLDDARPLRVTQTGKLGL